MPAPKMVVKDGTYFMATTAPAILDALAQGDRTRPDMVLLKRETERTIKFCVSYGLGGTVEYPWDPESVAAAFGLEAYIVTGFFANANAATWNFYFEPGVGWLYDQEAADAYWEGRISLEKAREWHQSGSYKNRK